MALILIVRCYQLNGMHHWKSHEIISRFLEELKAINNDYLNEEIARRWLGMSKTIKSLQH